LPSPIEVSPPADAPGQAQPFWRQGKVDYTWLPGLGAAPLQINDFDLSTTVAVPVGGDRAPLTFTPGLGAHLWQGPGPGRVPGAPDLPAHLYDAYLEFGWRPRLARWLFADLAVTPGLYTDLKDFNAETFQLRGRGVAVVAFSPQFQLVGGALYVNRILTKVLPAGGLIWDPDEDTKLFAVFPQPKLARRVATAGPAQWWAYLGGEFGGGKWSIERGNGQVDAVDYTDWRILLGLECLNNPGLKGHVEAGYVFNRAVRIRGNTSDHPDFEPSPTWMVRAGLFF
jgi:hypothetical protein